MKFAKMHCIAAVGLFTLLALPIQLAAQGNQNNEHTRIREGYSREIRRREKRITFWLRP
jgi:hypothetical protein